MAGLREFGVRMEAQGDAVSANADRLVRRVALSVDAVVVMATPVDTGRARSNWIVQLGSPSTREIEPLAEGEAATAASINAAKDVIEQYKGGVDLHLTNNLSYIGALNDGTSAQAPAGFVQTAVMQGVEQIKDSRILVTDSSGRRVFGSGQYGK